MLSQKSNSAALELINKPIHIGVIIIPNKPEMLALNMAPGILPLAIDTITTDEDTVDGSAAIKNMASQISSCSSVFIKGFNNRTSTGKIQRWIVAIKYEVCNY